VRWSAHADGTPPRPRLTARYSRRRDRPERLRGQPRHRGVPRSAARRPTGLPCHPERNFRGRRGGQDDPCGHQAAPQGGRLEGFSGLHKMVLQQYFGIDATGLPPIVRQEIPGLMAAVELQRQGGAHEPGPCGKQRVWISATPSSATASPRRSAVRTSMP